MRLSKLWETVQERETGCVANNELRRLGHDLATEQLEYSLKHDYVIQHLIHISHFIFLLMTCYLYLFQTREMMLDKKQIPGIFLFEFKIGYKAAETPHNINYGFGSGTANQCTVQQCFNKFCKGDQSLKDEKHSSQLLEVDHLQLRGSLKLIL